MSLPRFAFLAVSVAACVLAPARAAELDKLVPDNADLVVSVNLRQILDAPVMKKYVLPELESKILSETRKIVGLLGLNPVKDVTSFTVAFPGDGDPSKWVGIIHGDFDVRRLHAAVDQFAQSRPEGVKVHEHDQVRIYENLAGKDQKSAPRFFALLDKEVLLASPSKTCLLDAVARRGGQPVKANASLVTLIGKQDGKQSVWVAAVTSAAMKDKLGQKANLQDLGGKLQSIGGGLTLTDDIRINLRLQLSDANSARDMRRQLEALKAIAILAVSVNEDLKDYGPVLIDVLNAISFSQDQGLVGVDLTVPGAWIEKGVQSGKNPAPKPAGAKPR